MTKINLEISHSLTSDEVKNRFRVLFDQMKELDEIFVELTEKWKEKDFVKFSFSIEGLFVSGEVFIKKGNIQLFLELPMALYLIREKIENVLVSLAKKFFATV